MNPISPMTSAEIRLRFLAFFEKRGHAVIPSASLVTPDEKGVTNATLFNTAGMQPLVPFLLGKQHPAGTRLVDAQKCLRTVDIDDIGDKTHATFFEMLGNWSLGDYFKEEAINWSYEFLTNKEEGLGLDPQRLYVTVFEGDAVAPRDTEAAAIWREIFKKNRIDAGGDTTQGEAGRIFYMPAKNNWWEAGDNGPCGPDTEMFYDVSGKFAGRTLTHAEYVQADDVRDIIEIWNDVFMQYEKKDGVIIGKLPKPSVDTGAGLERLTMTLQGVDNIYDTDLLKPVMDLMKNPSQSLRNKRVIADHLRASTFLIADGVIPSNTDRGYILRRLIRRATISMTDKKLDAGRISKFVDTLTNTYLVAYPELAQKSDTIKQVLLDEATKFAEALAHGMKEFDRLAVSGNVSGADAFLLFSSYGLPIDVTKELAAERGLTVDTAAFEAEFKKHQDLSRAGAEQKFKGGLANADDPQVVRYHTATHLLHQALHDVLGEGVGQKGSNITAERLRFDFSYGAKMTDDEKKRVEDIINEKIAAKMPVNQVTMPKAEAEKTGARHFFAEKYGDEISIYFIGNDIASAYSKEFCGGPHVKNTSELAGPEGKWKFKIQKEEAISQGIRRIKAVLG
ncbi:MAG: Alanine--tRNA ligase [Candidatus Parcubacteria bacterium]|nr:Alanine--tRNA ligase [Candidatus Parcubacteria bacterium]